MVNKEKMIRLIMSIRHSMYFTKQTDIAEFLNIKNSSKNSIESRCRIFGYEVVWDND